MIDLALAFIRLNDRRLIRKAAGIADRQPAPLISRAGLRSCHYQRTYRAADFDDLIRLARSSPR
jgi:hypothetical protein